MPRCLRGAASAAGICLLFCLTVSAAPKKENTAVTSDMPPLAPYNLVVSTVNSAKPVETFGTMDAVMSATSEQERTVLKVVPEEEAGPQHQIHRVWLWQESHDCLWNLAKKYYNDPWQWKKIYLANKYQIDDPRKIFPKQVLIIPPLEELPIDEPGK